MIILILFAFIAGIVTILSPCILPVLPIILSSSVDSSGKRSPLGVVTGFVLSFTFFTIFLSTIVHVSGISADFLRSFSIIVLILFGASLLIPQFQKFVEIQFSKLSQFLPNGQTKHGFWGGLLIGLSLGLLWAPCTGPILASVISLALSGTITLEAVFITLAYAIGTAIPMFIIMHAGSTALKKIPWLIKNSGNIQKAFGLLMIFTAMGIFFNVDRAFQTYIIKTFPTYGVGLTQIENNDAVKNELEKINTTSIDERKIGKPMSDMIQPSAPEIIPGGRWFNLPENINPDHALESLKGKVVLIDFWTYSCINCQRTLPYLKDWYKKYKDKGLVIIGVHAPEFEFEKNEKNVAQAIKDFGLEYPIVQDNNFATWRAYSNQYWPAKYLIDKNGEVRFTHFGEGEYDATEKKIQELLKETGVKNVSEKISNPQYQVYTATPETYLGYGRLDGFASPESVVPNEISSYTAPQTLQDNFIAYSGDWKIMKEYANPQKGAQLLFNFASKPVFLVMRTKGKESKVKVYLDDKLQDFGVDNKDGVVTVNSDRLYKLINLPSPGRHILKLKFEDSNAELYAFTFG